MKQYDNFHCLVYRLVNHNDKTKYRDREFYPSPELAYPPGKLAQVSGR